MPKIYLCNGYPVFWDNDKVIYMHRYVMEEHLDRKLKKDEIVHHKDSDITNYNIENLELFSSHSEHMKQHTTSERMTELSKLGVKARWG